MESVPVNTSHRTCPTAFGMKSYTIKRQRLFSCSRFSPYAPCWLSCTSRGAPGLAAQSRTRPMLQSPCSSGNTQNAQFFLYISSLACIQRKTYLLQYQSFRSCKKNALITISVILCVILSGRRMAVRFLWHGIQKGRAFQPSFFVRKIKGKGKSMPWMPQLSFKITTWPCSTQLNCRTFSVIAGVTKSALLSRGLWKNNPPRLFQENFEQTRGCRRSFRSLSPWELSPNCHRSEMKMSFLGWGPDNGERKAQAAKGSLGKYMGTPRAVQTTRLIHLLMPSLLNGDTVF